MAKDWERYIYKILEIKLFDERLTKKISKNKAGHVNFVNQAQFNLLISSILTGTRYDQMSYQTHFFFEINANSSISRFRRN